MKIASLVIITKGDTVLLGFKKKGDIGAQTLNGPGGKLEAHESILECAVRETKEEVGIDLAPEALQEISIITFYAATVPDFRVHIFLTDSFTGEPIETTDMKPGWYSRIDLPYDQMLESDREWFAKAIRGEKFNANVYYSEQAKGFERIEFLPYEPVLK